MGEEPVLFPLKKLKPNDWNPNRMSQELFSSLVAGMKANGWLRSQPLLVWGYDENGKEQNVIIDGEHRYRGGLELKISQGPVVFLNGITRSKARDLTVEIDAKRGSFDREALDAIIREKLAEDPNADLSVEFGLPAEQIKTYTEGRTHEDGSFLNDLGGDGKESPNKPKPEKDADNVTFSVPVTVEQNARLYKVLSAVRKASDPPLTISEALMHVIDSYNAPGDDE